MIANKISSYHTLPAFLLHKHSVKWNDFPKVVESLFEEPLLCRASNGKFSTFTFVWIANEEFFTSFPKSS
jgi:hypothetical protein